MRHKYREDENSRMLERVRFAFGWACVTATITMYNSLAPTPAIGYFAFGTVTTLGVLYIWLLTTE